MAVTVGALLVVHLFTSAPGTYTVDRIYEFPSMQECVESLKHAQLKLSSGGDAESTGALYCVPGNPFEQYRYSHGFDKYEKLDKTITKK